MEQEQEQRSAHPARAGNMTEAGTLIGTTELSRNVFD